MIKIELKDITKINVGAIVNAANSNLSNGAGVAAAIERAGGKAFKREAKRLVKDSGIIKIGEVISQKSEGDLRSQYVINAVGPIYGQDPNNQAEQLFSCYYKSVQEAKNLGVDSIAFPAISCGIFSYPAKEAASIAIDALLKASKDLDFSDISICFLPDDSNLALAKIFADALNKKNNPFWKFLKDSEKNIIFYQEYPLSLNLAADVSKTDLSNVLDWYQRGLIPVRKSVGEPELFREGLVIIFMLARLSDVKVDVLAKSDQLTATLVDLLERNNASGTRD